MIQNQLGFINQNQLYIEEIQNPWYKNLKSWTKTFSLPIRSTRDTEISHSLYTKTSLILARMVKMDLTSNETTTISPFFSSSVAISSANRSVTAILPTHLVLMRFLWLEESEDEGFRVLMRFLGSSIFLMRKRKRVVLMRFLGNSIFSKKNQFRVLGYMD